ncbi:amidohydrolase family protein [Marinoscillum sp.]|uniref:metal-dependent hydrolase family protein n=1 Tax=Marinoscillum sp. TaxID=2024838 RepID=UPI003BA87013
MRKVLLSIVFILTSYIGFSQSVKISADRLFDGSEMHQNWSLIIEGNVIVAVGPSAKLSADSTIDLGNATLMPGMIEGHSHVLLYPYNQTDWNDQVLKESPALRAIRGSKAAEANLRAGFTTIRDLGSEGAGYADVAVKQSIELGINIGPRMLVAGPAIVATGSYGPKGFHDGVDVPLGAQEADGDRVIQVVREQIGKGADFIKVYADYRWGPEGQAMPTFSLEELELMVKTAASSDRDVVAHASTDEGIRRAVMAGVKTIEHGTAGTLETFQLMKEKGVGLCPTLAATYTITQYRTEWDGSEMNEPEAIKEKRDMFRRALESGVRIVAGGDVGVFPHGQNALELELMVQYGMKPLQVLQSVTSVNAAIFGLHQLGQLKEGYLADVIAVNGNPTEDIKSLYHPVMIIKDGKAID